MKTTNKTIKKILSIALCLALVMSYVPMTGLTVFATDTVTLPETLYVGGTEVIENGVVGTVTSGDCWNYDTQTGTLYLTDGADISYSSTTEEYLKNGIYCDGDLNIHASGTVTITGYLDGILLQSGGSLYFYAEEGANVTVSAEKSGNNGICSYGGSAGVAFNGNGTVNVNAPQEDHSTGIVARGTVQIDGVTLNARGGGSYTDIDGANIIIGETEAAIVNCIGPSCSGIGVASGGSFEIYNGSILHIGAKERTNSWVTGIVAPNIKISDSCVIMDGLKGTTSNYALHGLTEVVGDSHVLIRNMEATNSGGSCGLTTGSYESYQLTAEQDYYCRTDSTADFALNAEVQELGINYFELYTATHQGYQSNGDGTHYYGCPAYCLAAIKGENEACGGIATCTEQAFCETCGENYGEIATDNHTSDIFTDGFRDCCGEYQPATDTDNDGVYEISNAGQLYWYAQELNENNSEIYAELTKDIIIPATAPNWKPISASYVTFNGNYHTISGLKCVGGDMTYVGLFGNEVWWYEISNVHIADSYFEGGQYTGAVAGSMSNGGNVTNCYVTNTTITSSGSNVGGVVGYNFGNITNCYSYIDGITCVGYNSSYGGSVNNCYYLSETETEDGGKTADQFASGEVAYLLQSGNTEQVWGQNSNQAGATPILDSTGLYKVVTVGETGNYSVANVGDTNGDGTVDVADYQAVVNAAVSGKHQQSETASYDEIIKYDVNGDGYLDVLDASLMALVVNGKKTVNVYAVGDYDQNGVAFEDTDLGAIKHAIGNPTKLSTAEKYACDINGDGKVSEEDLTEFTAIYGEIDSEAHIFAGKKCKICGIGKLSIADISKTVYYNDNDNKLDLSTLFTLPDGAGNVTYELVSGSGNLDGSTLNIVLQGTEKIKVTIAETENYSGDEFEITVTVAAPKGSGSFDGEWVPIGF